LELNWSTFVLEIVNFLVLVWILKRFLYKPVLKVIAQRQAGIAKIRADAETVHAEAEKLREQYEGRLTDWNSERQQAREELTRELKTERSRKMKEVQNELELEREKVRVAEASRQADTQRRLEETSLQQAAIFATRLLEQVAGADVEGRFVELLITTLSQLPTERVAALRNSHRQPPRVIEVTSAYRLSDEQRGRLEQTLLTLTALKVPLHFEQNSDLLAGVRITVGGLVLGCNLQDELKGMAELTHAE
jgi:F-type H+-transporting ATPase subunit b